ncbi:MAG: PilZ domain-containing protein, partial [Bdellovibrionales bacterium]|nr:PilZ domain-containing protein [Bdellovibrionales bacterium]
RKCLSSHEIQQQRHKRYEVHMPSVLECYTRDLKIKTVLNNISTKGAGVEGHFGPLSRGDIVKLHLRFENSKKERIVSTRVQWIKRTAYGTEAAGLEFISDKVLYQYLLGQAIIS